MAKTLYRLFGHPNPVDFAPKMEKQGLRCRRLVLVPCPFQGHINPMLQLGTILHSKGFSITVAHTQFSYLNTHNHPDFVFQPLLSDDSSSSLELSDYDDFADFLSNLNSSYRASLRELLTRIVEEEQEQIERSPCVVYDALMYSVEAIAHSLKLPSIILRTSSMISWLAYFACPRLLEEGCIPPQGSESMELVPSFHPLRFKDLPVYEFKNQDSLIWLIATLRNTGTSSAIIWNSMDFLEQSSLAQFKQQCQVPNFSIGPMQKMAPTSSCSLWEEDHSCITWLDKQTENSVIYVSFGSIATMDEKELAEIAWGLANSKQPFLWVLRPGSVNGSNSADDSLSDDFKETVEERSCIVNWAPQEQVLAHRAVGGFFTHCGWNSTIESISEGVPMICRPIFDDQRICSRYISHVWRVGIEFENGLERGEIEKAIKMLMVAKEGDEMRQRASNLKLNSEIYDSSSLSSERNDSFDFLVFLSNLNLNHKASLQELLTRIVEEQEKEQHEGLPCVIYDALMYSVEEVAHSLKLSSIILHSSCASSVLSYFAYAQLREEGRIPSQGSKSMELVPGLHPFRFKDLPVFDFKNEGTLLPLIATLRNKGTSSSAIIWNSMDCLEQSPLAEFQQQFQVPNFSIGPMQKIAPASSSSLWEEDHSCIIWLDKQTENSVLYVSFGSIVIMDEKEVMEIAWGLANSKHPFLWVLRSGSVHGSDSADLLSDDFKETVGERGCIVKWAPQEQVLAHRAVGGFLSHCGWNSTIESISEGVPMICRPIFGDQRINSRYISHVWRVGIELKNGLEREEIEKAIKMLMVEKQGEEMKQRAANLKLKTQLCIQKNGSSYNSLNELVELLEYVKMDQIKALLDNGVLTVTLPKKEAEKPDVNAIQIFVDLLAFGRIRRLPLVDLLAFDRIRIFVDLVLPSLFSHPNPLPIAPKMEKQGLRCRRLVLVPCPLQGHINPMLQLATILHSKGFSITVAHTQFTSLNTHNNHPDFVFQPLLSNDSSSSLELSDYDDFADFLSNLNSSYRASLQELLAWIVEEEQKQQEGFPCVIYDAIMYSVEAIAHSLKLPSIILRTSSANSWLAYFACPRLLEEGCVPPQGSESMELVVPGFYPLRFKDLPVYEFKNQDSLIQLIATLQNTGTSSAIIWNSMNFLEQSSLAQFQQQCQVPNFSVGPMQKMAPTSSCSLWEEDDSCITWLDKQTENSAIYVSFGSIATMDEKELAEIAWGLANSKQPFLWVLRPGSVNGSNSADDLLSDDFKETVRERGCIVKWAPQEQVLGHHAVGGFLSHCGWNSTIESISEGVPMLCRPIIGDQRICSRYISHVWRVGIELENGLEREEIEKAIKRLMVEKQGEEMRERAVNLKMKAQLCIQEGGSTYNSLNNLVELLMSV
ncbi:hypothetical protein EZV62_002799 [Acer yangbiense]|uniref:SHSP domain-containing protein n=1 Tax=Acer yangbiense TaxID=1000413 RepID=A0A5C7IYB3_9ROSI|nr:hypothetical protein EZV62_002799 [Acer yangbiense]